MTASDKALVKSMIDSALANQKTEMQNFLTNLFTTTPATLRGKIITASENTISGLKESSFAQTVQLADALKEISVPAPTPAPTPPALVNLLQFPNDLDNGAWGGNVIVKPNQIAAPDGTMTADEITAGAGQYGGLLRLRDRYDFQNKLYTLSAYVKRNNWDFVGLRLDGSTDGQDRYPFVNLVNLTKNTLNISGVTLNAVAGADGWIKVSMSYTPPAGLSFVDVCLVRSDGASFHTFSGIEKAYVWGVSLT